MHYSVFTEEIRKFLSGSANTSSGAALQTETLQAMTKKALCVGINRFRNYPSATLNGCVNDANAMKALLTGHFGFSPGNITTLTDSKATKTAIMTELRKMAEGSAAGKDDHLVFSFSSHGTQVPDTEGDEPDKYDEAFCPYDLAQEGDRWHPLHLITDDELSRIFAMLPDGVTLEVFLDTCHSGTGIRAIDLLFDRKPRYLPPPSLRAFLETAPLAPRTLAHRLDTENKTRHVLWAGCRASQTSADALIDGAWHGAFTYFLCREISAGTSLPERGELLKKIRAGLKAGKYTQVPQLECENEKKNSLVGS